MPANLASKNHVDVQPTGEHHDHLLLAIVIAVVILGLFAVVGLMDWGGSGQSPIVEAWNRWTTADLALAPVEEAERFTGDWYRDLSRGVTGRIAVSPIEEGQRFTKVWYWDQTGGAPARFAVSRSEEAQRFTREWYQAMQGGLEVARLEEAERFTSDWYQMLKAQITR
jgi:hypothetical protein